MDQGIAESINDFLVVVAQNNHKLLKAYLFGSYAKNTQHVGSDIDLALVLDDAENLEKFDLLIQLMVLASKIDLRIEPHPITKSEFASDGPFVNEIKRTGIEIHL
jgi:predicted nucleotidyltransferase